MRAFLILATEQAAAPADASIVDLGAWGWRRSVAFLEGIRTTPVWLMLGPTRNAGIAAILDAIVPARPDGLVLAGAESGHDVEHLSALLRPREADAGLPDRGIPVAVALGTPGSLLRLESFRNAGPRLAGLLLDVADLPAGTHDHARATTLLAASAADVPAWLVDDDRDPAEARRAGFAGMATRNPARLEAIQRA